MLAALTGMAPFLAIAVAFAASAKASGLDQTLARVFSGYLRDRLDGTQ